MTEVIHSVIIRKNGQEFVSLVETTNEDEALQLALAEAEGYAAEDCEVLQVLLEPGAALPIGFFWKRVVWLDDWGPTVAPSQHG